MKQLLIIGLLLALPSAASAERPQGKPSAPVVVRLESRATGGGYQMTLVATPTLWVNTLELTLAGKRLAFGATPAGQQRTLTVQINVATGAGVDVVGTAAVGANGSVRTKAAVARVGTAKLEAPKPLVIRMLRDGRDVAESR